MNQRYLVVFKNPDSDLTVWAKDVSEAAAVALSFRPKGEEILAVVEDGCEIDVLDRLIDLADLEDET